MAKMPLSACLAGESVDDAEASTEPLSWWVAVICFGMCFIGFLGRFAYRKKGRLAETWLRYHYFNENLSPVIRYAPLNFVPTASIFALWGAVAVLSHLPDNDITDYAIGILAILSAIAAAVAVKRHLSGYPDEVKPQWLLEEERRRGIGAG
ncbi:hypothetical protein SAMN05443665_10523 [Actinomadura meyerae]|uniref:Uncharacterized protein n=1 Tax=Actinomadura meyerae TaxID=240840 RepID=A0A239NWM0_9ACTN|nr:hypothetical protein [Actinomadura meyerae]SNT59205.1 hypothetical protein SAMN05443665_10523 [Actinomadura meyerae]